MGGSRPPSIPPRADVEAKLVGLIEGRCTRQEVADWAMQWVGADDTEVEDHAVWEALTRLVAADLRTVDRPYLHEEVDFRAWLDELRNA